MLRVAGTNLYLAMALPFHQRAIVVLSVGLGALIVVGAVLDTLSNAATWITPRVTNVGTAFLLFAIPIANMILRRWPLDWVVRDTTVRINRFGAMPIAVVLALIGLLWFPRLVDRASERADRGRERPPSPTASDTEKKAEHAATPPASSDAPKRAEDAATADGTPRSGAPTASATAGATSKLFLDCIPQSPPQRFPDEGPIHVLDASEKIEGRRWDGLMPYGGMPGAPTRGGYFLDATGHYLLGLKCQLTNYATVPLFNVRFLFKLKFMVSEPTPGGGSQSGPVTADLEWPVHLQKIDVGPAAPFVFWAINRNTDRFVQIRVARKGTALLGGTTGRRALSVVVGGSTDNEPEVGFLLPADTKPPTQ